MHGSNNRRYAIYGAFLASRLGTLLKNRGLIAETRVGARICITLLDRMVTLYDAEDSSDGGKAFDFG